MSAETESKFWSVSEEDLLDDLMDDDAQHAADAAEEPELEAPSPNIVDEAASNNIQGKNRIAR